MVELYWQAILRDVPFDEYSEHPHALAASQELNAILTESRNGVVGSEIPDRLLFRGMTRGDSLGPYVSQFLLQPVPFRPIVFEQRIETAAPGHDYLVSFDEWMKCHNGAVTGPTRTDRRYRFIRSGRDLAEYVHRDFSYQAYLGACLMLLRWATPADGANPFKHSYTQSGFATFGPPFAISLLASATQLALKTAWFQKWLVHRRLRPETFGARVHNHLSGVADYPIHASLLESEAITRLPFTAPRRGPARSWLLPMAYPEGSPTHPSYPAAHAVVAGACTTVLKALFDESFEIPSPIEASPDGLAVAPLIGTRLEVGGELDKLASNISLARSFAGVHYRSDSSAGLSMGEEIAVALLKETRFLTPGHSPSYSFTGFGGRRITVT